MTPAEQVACDALRSAGLDELADNLAFAREAVKVRERIMEDLTCDVDGCCTGCGVFSYAAHRKSCRLWGLLNSDPAWLPAEIERAHKEALQTLFNVDSAPSLLGEWAQRQTGMLFASDPDRPGQRVVVSPQALEAYNREYGSKRK